MHTHFEYFRATISSIFIRHAIYSHHADCNSVSSQKPARKSFCPNICIIKVPIQSIAGKVGPPNPAAAVQAQTRLQSLKEKLKSNFIEFSIWWNIFARKTASTVSQVSRDGRKSLLQHAAIPISCSLTANIRPAKVRSASECLAYTTVATARQGFRRPEEEHFLLTVFGVANRCSCFQSMMAKFKGSK